MTANSRGIRSANWHMTEACNYRCKFCFFHRVGERPATEEDAGRILGRLRSMGIEKINLVGGEPLLHPHIVKICHTAKELGFVVGMTSNGSLITDELLDRLEGSVDWFGISIDSADEAVEARLGRGAGDHVARTKEACSLLKARGIRLKVNSTITTLNWGEDLRPLITELGPERWKVFQFLHIRGQNDAFAGELSVRQEQFEGFRLRNRDISLAGGHAPVFESSQDMLGSYMMVSPQGSLIVNTSGSYETMPLSVGMEKADPNIIDVEKYVGRGGVYDWK